MYLSHVGGQRSCGVDEALTGAEMRRMSTVIRALMRRRWIAAGDVVTLFPDQNYIVMGCKGQDYGAGDSMEMLLKDNLVVCVFFVFFSLG